MPYLIRQVSGGVELLAGAEPVDRAQNDERIPAVEREELKAFKQLLDFASDEGLSTGDSYTSYVRIGDRPLVYVLSASPPDRLLLLTWSFPIVGEVPYKGFFDLDAAQRQKKVLQDAGFETLLGGASAFSSLGWYSDPIISSFLVGDIGERVDLILHELTHKSFFIVDDMRFNESLASFVANKLTLRYLRCINGKDSPELLIYEKSMRDKERFMGHLRRAEKKLQLAFESESKEERLVAREAIFANLKEMLGKESFETGFYRSWGETVWNIPMIMAFDLYRGERHLLEEAWHRSGESLPEFFEGLQRLAGAPFADNESMFERMKEDRDEGADSIGNRGGGGN